MCAGRMAKLKEKDYVVYMKKPAHFSACTIPPGNRWTYNPKVLVRGKES